MPDLRKDPIVGRWVIIAKSRAKRPHDFETTPRVRGGKFCPFCEHNEDKTPGEILAYRKPGSPANGEGWRVLDCCGFNAKQDEQLVAGQGHAVVILRLESEQICSAGRFEGRADQRPSSASSGPLHWFDTCAIRRLSQRRKVLTILEMRV